MPNDREVDEAILYLKLALENHNVDSEAREHIEQALEFLGAHDE